MPLITLLKPGSLVFKDAESQAAHANTIPIEYIIQWFKDRIHKEGAQNRILILLSSTGSGKSTALPPAIFKEFGMKGGTNTNIIVTQPRVINAITIPKDQIAGSEFYKHMKLGENMGWQTGPSKKQSAYGLTYATVGVLIAQFKTLTDDQIIDRYRFIIIDEAHEASLDLALLLYMLKNFFTRNEKNPKLPFLVLMSATFDANKFLSYFGVDNFIQVSGFAYPLTERWDTINVSVVNYISAAVDTVKKIHLQGMNDPIDNRDILVFMPSRNEILECISRIKVLNKTLGKKDLLLPLIIDREAVNSNNDDYRLLFADISDLNDDAVALSRLLPDDNTMSQLLRNDSADNTMSQLQGNRFAETTDNTLPCSQGKHSAETGTIFRRVIFGTSVLETGVTLDTLKYVCDSGYHRGPQFIANFSVGGVVTVPATKSRIRQRAGRANRKSEGEFWPLYPKYIYDSLEDNQLSDIETSDISPVMLSILAQQIPDNKNIIRTDRIDTIDKIPLDMIEYQLEKLYCLGFISPQCDVDFYRTPIGGDPDDMLKNISELPVNSNHTYGITKLGQIAAMFNGLTPEQIKLILSAYMWGCSVLDMIAIAAYMSIKQSEFKANMSQDIKWVEVYRLGLPFYLTSGNKKTPDDKVVYRTRLIVADDFIDGLVLFTAIEQILSEKGGLDTLERWCRKSNIKYNTCLTFLAIRDDIIEQALQIGLNPFYGNKLKTADEKEFTNNIVSIKHCILDAWRLNIAEWDDVKKSYVMQNGLQISTPPAIAIDEKKLMFEKTYGVKQKYNPKFIICEGFSLKIIRNKENINAPTMYEIKSYRISVLDGYVDA